MVGGGGGGYTSGFILRDPFSSNDINTASTLTGMVQSIFYGKLYLGGPSYVLGNLKGNQIYYLARHANQYVPALNTVKDELTGLRITSNGLGFVGIAIAAIELNDAFQTNDTPLKYAAVFDAAAAIAPMYGGLPGIAFSLSYTGSKYYIINYTHWCWPGQGYRR